jgi:RNA polymerase sigma-70 factor (ECF subfamily)
MTDQTINLLGEDRNSLKNLFGDYYQPLCHLSMHYLEDPDEAKGVVQEAFIKLWEIRNELNANSNLQNFLYTLVKNNCLNILKRKQILLKHHEKIKWMEMHYQFESLTRLGADIMEINELKEQIDLAIMRLPEHCRIVFEMSRYEDLKNREIAEKMGITQKTVEAHLTKALKILRNNLKEYLSLIVTLAYFFY